MVKYDTKLNAFIKNHLKHNNIHIFVYGSLMNPYSFKKTMKRTPNHHPVILKKSFGFRRTYSVICEDLNRIYLGIYKSNRPTKINGSLIQINNYKELKLLMRREVHYYMKKIPKKYFTFTDSETEHSVNDFIYTFVPYIKKVYKKPPNPVSSYNNYMQYLQKTMAGYYYVSPEFLNLFLKTTDNLE